MWINTTNLQVYTQHTDIRTTLPNMSLPATLTDDILQGIGFAVVTQDTKPVYNKFTHIATVQSPVFADGAWVQTWVVTKLSSEVVVANLASEKIAKNTQINQWRAAENQSTFIHLGKTIACDALSRSDIDAVAGAIALNNAFPSGFPSAWKSIDNTYLPLPDIAAFKSMYNSMTLQGSINFGHSQTLKTALAAATTIDQVNSIVW